MSDYKTPAEQNEMWRAMSTYMIGNAIPMREELARRKRLLAMWPKERLNFFWRHEVTGRAWEPEFNAIYCACLDGDRNERRREELFKQFMAPFPNREIDGTEDGYVKDRDGYTARGFTLMFATIGIA